MWEEREMGVGESGSQKQGAPRKEVTPSSLPAGKMAHLCQPSLGAAILSAETRDESEVMTRGSAVL